MIDLFELLRRDQDATSEYVQNCLKELEVEYKIDEYGNIYNLDNENAPLLSAHMDTVRKDVDKIITGLLIDDGSDKIKSGGILGGDDKCGVYIILEILKSKRVVNFIFSRDEEIGCKGISAFVSGKNKDEIEAKLKSCLYCLVLDRRGNSDIICVNNNYGTKEFQDALVEVSNKEFEVGNSDGNIVTASRFSYKPATGLCSDANTIRSYVSTANLSVGYYEPHRQSEYILKSDLKKAFDYVSAIIDEIKTHFDAPKTTYNYYSNGYGGNSYGYGGNSYGYGGYYGGYGGWDYDDYDYYSGWYDSEFGKDIKKKGFTTKPKKCAMCGCDERDARLFKFTMPFGTIYDICDYCLDDLDDEIKRIKESKMASEIKKEEK